MSVVVNGLCGIHWTVLGLFKFFKLGDGIVLGMNWIKFEREKKMGQIYAPMSVLQRNLEVSVPKLSSSLCVAKRIQSPLSQ